MYFGIFRSCTKKIPQRVGLDPMSSSFRGESHSHWTMDIYGFCNKKGSIISADNLPDKSRNLSSYIMECGSSEKFELLLEKFQLILRRTFFRNVCYNIFMKQLGNIRGKRNIPPAFTTVYLPYFHCFLGIKINKHMVC